MKVLLLDIGNSRVKWALARGGRIGTVQARAHQGTPAALLATLQLPRADELWVAHVMGTAHERAIARALARATGIKPRFARSQAHCAGLRVAYRDPSRLGVDRFLSMLALWTQGRRAFCVASAGTALTFDAVDAKGRHLGGLIAPGLSTAWSAVRGATRFALAAKPSDFTRGLGTDTDACVRQGVLHACVGLIEHAAQDRAGPRFLTGGDTAVLRQHLDARWKPRPDLVLEGLLAYAQTVS